MADDSQRPDKEQLIKTVTEVYENFKDSPDYQNPTVAELNNRGVPRLTGDEPWTKEYLDGFFRNHLRGLRGGKRPKRKEQPKPTKEKRQATPPETEAPPVQKDGEVLQEIIEWWKSGKANEAKRSLFMAPHYPAFKDEFKKGNRSLSLRTEIMQRAEKKIQRDKVRTGGSLPNLVDLLLWHYIGSPDDLLEPPYEEAEGQE